MLTTQLTSVSDLRSRPIDPSDDLPHKPHDHNHPHDDRGITQCKNHSAEAGKLDQVRFQGAVREMLLAMGEDPDRDGLKETPARVARAFAHLCGGLHESPAEHLTRVFDAAHSELVLVTGFEFSSLCEHHLLPFRGKAHVAYLPSEDRVVGLSKLARTVDVFARRPQVQERLTAQIADAIEQFLKPVGVFVILEAEHMCMQLRGVEKCHGQTVTKATRGLFTSDAASRAEVLGLLQR